MRRRDVNALFAGLLGHALGCSRRSRRADDKTLLFKHQPLWGDPARFRAMLATFRERTGWEVVGEALPSSSDAAHQFFLTSLEGGESGFDVFVADVVWIPEFARAGWVNDISDGFPAADVRRDFIAGAADAVIVGDRTFAVPWYVDVGLLYRRTDIAPDAPRTYDELVTAASRAKADGRCDHGYVWQGRQYEGLVCNAFEAIWGHGGETFEGGRIRIDTPEAVRALDYLRSLVTRGVSPPSVTAMAEEESRRPFQAGRAAFHRNWPYALVEAEKPDSPLRGRVAVSPLPTVGGEPGSGALGGYQLAVSADIAPSRRQAALDFLRHMTSEETNVSMALSYGRNPARRAVYGDERIRSEAPNVAAIEQAVLRARPRPVTPYYALLADTLQSELSAAVSGIRSAQAALRRAQRACDRITGTG